MESNPDTIRRVMQVLTTYCNPKKEYDGIPPRDIAEKIIKAVEGE